MAAPSSGIHTGKIHVDKIRAVLLDMDGVVYIGERPIPGVQNFADYLESTNRQWICVTNNATKTPEMFVEKLERMQIRATKANVLGSAVATAHWMAQKFPNGGKVIMVGQEGLRRALMENGFEETIDPQEADYAVVGMHFELTFEELARTALAIRNGAFFVGTNPDPSFPSERGLLPGAGSIIKMMETTTGTEPVIIGKPNAGMFELAMSRLGTQPEETLMVGDRYDTDIEGAINLGMPTVGVLTGVTSREEFEAQAKPPDLILDDVSALHRLFMELDG